MANKKDKDLDKNAHMRFTATSSDTSKGKLDAKGRKFIADLQKGKR